MKGANNAHLSTNREDVKGVKIAEDYLLAEPIVLVTEF